MHRSSELTKEEFAYLANTEAMVVFLTTKFKINNEEAEFIRRNATMPFHIRPAGYLEEHDIAYFSTTEEAIKFQLLFEKNLAEEPIPGKITDIHSKIHKE